MERHVEFSIQAKMSNNLGEREWNNYGFYYHHYRVYGDENLNGLKRSLNGAEVVFNNESFTSLSLDF